MIGGRIATQMVLGADSFTAGINNPSPAVIAVITITAIIVDLDNCLSPGVTGHGRSMNVGPPSMERSRFGAWLQRGIQDCVLMSQTSMVIVPSKQVTFGAALL